ncbi:hypothetical protein BZG36_04861 [Bifiguratus adelaidae]|uniref:Uncharacterized protein n=1 Tax=Bifiguratus adelaidae TaxID=1938954 RepID=A0A261XVK9_9FUNG|nr:hypothetical protein BZG36_04861 [Bifiguratus adelaidae]
MPKASVIKETNGLLHKRTAQHAATKPNDIYVSRSSSFAGQLARGKKLFLEEGYKEITIHGLGASIERALSLSLAIQAVLHDQVTLLCHTKTVNLYDDIVPDDMVKYSILMTLHGSDDVFDEDEDYRTQKRQNSGVEISIVAKDSIHELINTGVKYKPKVNTMR